MAVERLLSAAERQRVIDERLDELDRLLLGLLPRTERLAIVTDVESRVKALGDDVPLAELPATVPAALLARTAGRPATRRSRAALTSGVLGIISAGCLLISPILLIGATVCAEMLGEEITIALMSLFVFVLVVGGGLAVFLGGASIIRLARSGQSKTGTGWAITGLCTGLLPMLIGGVGLLAIGAQCGPATYVAVTPGPAYTQGPMPVQYSQVVGSPPIYGQPMEWNAKVPPGVPMPMPPAPPYPPAPVGPAMIPADSGPPAYSEAKLGPPNPEGPLLPPAPPAPSKKPAAPTPPTKPTATAADTKEEAAKSAGKTVPATPPAEEEEKLGIDFED
jgi:hypothetical protein